MKLTSASATAAVVKVRKALVAGSYRATVTATGPGGVSAPQRKSCRVRG